jgi:hypothetical protein
LTPTHLVWLFAGYSALAAAGASLLLRDFWKSNPQEIERRRRRRLEQLGRMTQCEIVDVIEMDPALPSATTDAPYNRPIPPAREPRWRAVVTFRYTISGVSYETAEDVMGPSGEAAPPVPGQIAIVKYDPAIPSNSILLAGSWCETGAGTVQAAARERGK